jgi:hypothetical protein
LLFQSNNLRIFVQTRLLRSACQDAVSAPAASQAFPPAVFFLQTSFKRHAPLRKAAAAYVAATKERNAFNPTQNGFEFSISEIEEFLTGPDLIKLAICQGGLKFHAQTVANRRPRKLLGCAR